jgi:hypothetical protein
MKTVGANRSKNLKVRIEPAMAKYRNIMLHPEKLEKLNNKIQTNQFPPLPTNSTKK